MTRSLGRCFALAFLISGFALSGCSFRSKEAPPTEPTPPDSTARASLPSAQPLDISVAQELNDGNRLFVKVAIDARTRWSTADATLRITGYRNGEKIAEQLTPLTVLGPILESGAHRELPIVVEAPTMTDYQLELLWGAESRALVSAEPAGQQATPNSVAEILELRNVMISSERVRCT